MYKSNFIAFLLFLISFSCYLIYITNNPLYLHPVILLSIRHMATILYFLSHPRKRYFISPFLQFFVFGTVGFEWKITCSVKKTNNFSFIYYTEFIFGIVNHFKNYKNCRVAPKKRYGCRTPSTLKPFEKLKSFFKGFCFLI